MPGASEIAERLQHRFSEAHEPMLVGNGRDILDANAPMCSLLRLPQAVIRTLHVADILVGGAEEANRLEDLRRASGSVVGETTLLRGDGSTMPVRFWSIVLAPEPRKVRAYSGIMPLERFPSLHETNALLRDLFDESPDGKLVVDESGYTIYANQSHLDLWQLTRADVGLPFEGRWAKTASRLRDPGQFIAMQEAVAAGEAGPFRMDMADGRVLEVRSVPIHHEDGRHSGRSYTTRDFTAAVRAQEELSTHAALLEAISSNSPDGIVAVDNAGVPLHHNQRFLELWSLEPSHFNAPLRERADSLLSRVANPERYRAAIQQISRPVAREFVAEFEMRDGRIISLQVVPMLDAEGNRIGHASHFRDVSAERRAERDLRESEDRYRTLVSSLPLGVVLQFADGRIGECNEAAQRILGLSRDELLGLTSFDARWHCVDEGGSQVPVEMHPAVITLRTGEACKDVIMGVHHANGALRWLLVNSVAIRSASGVVEGAVISFQDITEQRQAQTSLIQARTAEAFNALASGVAHKVNNSLASIVGNAYLAGLPSGVPAETVESLTEIMAAASDATGLVRDLQALSRREGQGLRPVGISEAVVDVVAALPIEERARVIETLQDNLPSVIIDPAGLNQAMSGLIRNALDAGEQVVVATFIEQRVATYPDRESAPRPAPPGRYLCFEVRDDGPGIAPEIAGRIFEPFVTTRFVGRGLGLAATAGIMTTHHGFVEVESTGQGCAARLLFPLA